MLPGYNTDVQHDGLAYHIQTEDNGESNPSIVTLIYQGGAILWRKKADYSHLLKSGAFHDELRNMMREQHREMIKALMEGKLETQPQKEAVQPPAEKMEMTTLDDAIMQFLADTE